MEYEAAMEVSLHGVSGGEYSGPEPEEATTNQETEGTRKNGSPQKKAATPTAKSRCELRLGRVQV